MTDIKSHLRSKLSRVCLLLRVVTLATLCTAASGAAPWFVPAAVAETAPQKVIEGKVLNEGEAAQPGAVVYLKNAKSDVIKSYIAAADGGYRFGQLAPDSDYTLWAELNGKKSATKTITAFDNKKQFQINLHITDKGK